MLMQIAYLFRAAVLNLLEDNLSDGVLCRV